MLEKREVQDAFRVLLGAEYAETLTSKGEEAEKGEEEEDEGEEETKDSSREGVGIDSLTRAVEGKERFTHRSTAGEGKRGGNDVEEQKTIRAPPPPSADGQEIMHRIVSVRHPERGHPQH